MAKYLLSSIVGAIVLMSIGGTVMYSSDYKFLFTEMPDKEIFIFKYDSGDKIEIVTKSAVCDYALFRITKDETTIKCGSRVVTTAKWYLEYLKTYGEDSWVRLNRKKAITLDVQENENGYVVKRVTPYYATKSNTGYAGDLTETFEITKDRMKSTLEFRTDYKTRDWRVIYRNDPNVGIVEETQETMKLEKNLNIFYSDKLFDYRNDNDAYYKVQPGSFKIDPTFQFGNLTGTSLGSGNFRFGYCSECENDANISFTEGSSSLTATYESGWIWMQNLSLLVNFTSLCEDNAGAGICEMSIRNGSYIIPDNSSSVITRCIFNGSMTCLGGSRIPTGTGTSFNEGGAINGYDGVVVRETDTLFLGINTTENATSLGNNFTINLSRGTLDIMVMMS